MTSQKVFSRTAEQVIREFQEIHELGITDVQIYDDTFSWSHTRVKEICEGILDLRLPVRWAIRDRVNRADRDLYRLMKKAGCYRIHFGVESGSPRILDGSRKGITLHQVTQAIQWAKEAGFITLTYFMFGFPEEQLTDIKRTIRFSRKLDADYAVFAALIPYPGTELYAMGLEKGIIPEDFWLRFAKEPQPDFTIPFLYEQHFSQKELLFFKDLALRKFYLRPRRILKELASITSFPEFKKKWSMGVTVLSDALRSLFGFP